jgi:undecaprenyl-diphosphatase
VGRYALLRLTLALAALAALAFAVSDQTFLRGEVGLLDAVNDLPTVAGWPLRAVMQLGTLAVALTVTAGAAWLTRDLGRRPALAMLVAVLVAFRVDNVLKDVIDRPRPPAVLDDLHVREAASGFGFPSGHTTMAFALAASIHSLLPRRWRWVAWSLAAVVGVARMHVAAHWPADIAGGAALGTAVGTAAWLLVATPTPRTGAGSGSRGAPRPPGPAQ